MVVEAVMALDVTAAVGMVALVAMAAADARAVMAVVPPPRSGAALAGMAADVMAVPDVMAAVAKVAVAKAAADHLLAVLPHPHNGVPAGAMVVEEDNLLNPASHPTTVVMACYSMYKMYFL